MVCGNQWAAVDPLSIDNHDHAAVEQPFFIEPSTLAELGFPELCAALAERAETPMGKARAGTLGFLSDESAVERSLASIEEARNLLGRALSIPVGGVDDVAPHIDRAEKGAMLTATELGACARLLRAALGVRSFLRAHELEAPLLSRRAADLPVLTAVAHAIEDVLEPSGTLRDDASPELARTRARARSLHGQIQSYLDEAMGEPTFAGHLREQYYSLRNERYVIPVLAASRAKVPGIVHNASQSGQTLFVEPEAIVGLGNELAIARSLADEEERRILTELSQAVGEAADDVRATLQLVGWLDLVQAQARMAQSLDASVPTLEADRDGPFSLRSLRHPLLVLQGKKVVPSHVELERGVFALVVSGPNAGGKTVTITAVALAALMLRAGMPIAAESGSRLPLMRGVLSAVGDAQNLAEGLSTFSGHVKRLAHMTDLARSGWLVIVDEIAADTDPVEGAAIAAAVLEHFAARHARAFVTTHLDALKALAVTDARFANARVRLDPITQRPSYTLELGSAGMSNALELAAQVGLASPLLQRARALLETGGQLTVALQRLDARQRELDGLRATVDAERRRAEAARVELETERARVVAQRDAERAQARSEVLAELEPMRAELKRMVAALQAAPTMREAQTAQQEVERVVDALEQTARREAVIARADRAHAVGATSSAGKQALRPGMRVLVIPLEKEGELLSIEADAAVVAMGMLRSRVAFSDVVPLVGKKRSPARAPAKGIAARAIGEPGSRLDVRGMRADEAERALGRFLDALSLDGPADALIVHGHGTGALKKLVRDFLAASPFVEAQRPGEQHEGGDGVTLLHMRS